MTETRALAKLLDTQRDSIMQRWRQRALQLDPAQELPARALDDHVPMLIGSVIASLDRAPTGDPPAATEPGAPVHGTTRLHDGYALDDVVAELSMLRSCTIELAEEAGHVLRGTALQELYNAVDRIIGDAVSAYASEMSTALQRQHAEHLAFIAHDLRSPLNAMALSVEVLARSWPKGDAHSEGETQAQQMLGNLSRSVRRLSGMVDRVLEDNIIAAARNEASVMLLRVADIDLLPLISDLARRFEADARAAGSQIAIDVQSGLKVRGDAVLLERALQNLLVNAIQHASPGVVRIEANREGRSVVCQVLDQGGGLRNASQPDRSKRGLGLRIARQFVQSHGGEMRIDSRSDGTTVRIELPDGSAA